MARIGSKAVPLVLATSGTASALLVSYVPSWRNDMLREPNHCLFRRLTGYRCPFCGMTHAVVDVLHGHLAAATTQNATVYLLVFAVMVAFAARTQAGMRLIATIRARWSFVNSQHFALVAGAYSVARDVL